MISRVLVSNRGEIAVRVLTTCAQLGIETVAIHSHSDQEAWHVRIADDAVAIDAPSGSRSYLDIAAIVDAAKSRGCDAVHPGYGFLSERAEFAAAVEEAGLIFIGPPAHVIATMADKIKARECAVVAEVPIVPGTDQVSSVGLIEEFADTHGLPLLLKASAGGGGRGMRLIRDASEISHALEGAQREAEAAFGDAAVYLERYLDSARHVEVQVLADTHGTVLALGDRDCSVQRRHQKLVEEAPAPGLADATRAAMAEAAIRLAEEVDYVGAGTVEFLYEPADEAFYFLEMNTRIQVEHPVTEEVLGIDLVAAQLDIAAGRRLSVAARELTPRGHAIEVRVNAEDVSTGAFIPSPGLVTDLRIPVGPGIRFDSGYEPGDDVLPDFDSLIGKLVVWAPTRGWALVRAVAALEGLHIVGPPTTIPAATAILRHPDFVAGAVGTRWLEHELELTELLSEELARHDEDGVALSSVAGPAPASMPASDDGIVWVGGREYKITSATTQPPPGDPHRRPEAPRPAQSRPEPSGRARSRFAARPAPDRRAPRDATGADGKVRSPMQGTVIALTSAVGDAVMKGQVLLVLEAMKMENSITADVDGEVVAITVEVGDVVASGEILVEIEPGGAA
ncbi:MAG: biotin carboxylase N-terminal domain-containing protein [Acidimicrobiales bacterium]